MKTLTLLCAAAFAVLLVRAQENASKEATARDQEATACTPCHSLRIVHIQRLSSAAWNKELDKMIGWGAVVRDRKLLADYLSEEYSDKKPVEAPAMSADGRTQRSK